VIVRQARVRQACDARQVGRCSALRTVRGAIRARAVEEASFSCSLDVLLRSSLRAPGDTHDLTHATTAVGRNDDVTEQLVIDLLPSTTSTANHQIDDLVIPVEILCVPRRNNRSNRCLDDLEDRHSAICLGGKPSSSRASMFKQVTEAYPSTTSTRAETSGLSRGPTATISMHDGITA
jgi:hypothetical protein